MGQPLRVLMIGGTKNTNRLVVKNLQKGGYDPKFREITTEQQLHKAIEAELWDLIISDYTEEAFSTQEALNITKMCAKDVPFIVFSDKKTPETYNSSISFGVHDFLNIDEIDFLIPVVQKNLHQAGVRRAYRRTEEALQKCEASFRLFLNTEPSAIMVFEGSGGQIVDANRAAEKLYGYSRLELLEMRYADLTSQSDPNTKALELPQFSQPTSSAMPFEQLHKKRDGTQFLAEIHFGAHNKDEQSLSIIKDISHTKRLEEQLLGLQKKELLGRLAGYIAHDFNNLLGIIIGYSHLALWELEESNPMRNEIEEISKAAHRAADLTRQLLAFSRKDILQAKIIDINESVRSIETMLRRLIGEHIELEVDLYPEPIQIKVDPGLLEQIIMNLSVDARDAMPQGGKIDIETRSAHLKPEDLNGSDSIQPGYYAILAIDHRNNIHNSNKTEPECESPAKPLDLGLTVARDITRKCNGYITSEINSQKGTSVKIYLPKVQRPISEHCEKNIPKKGNETILVVEDDDLLLELIDRMLGLCGYNVLCARQGNEALQMAEKHVGDIHLLLTDVIMPHMSGTNLAANMKALQPKMKILYMSGYSSDAIDHHGITSQDVPIIQKPFTLDKLSVIIRSVLDGTCP